MKGQLRINEMYAYVVVDTDGTEGIPAFLTTDGIAMPMVGADTARAVELRPYAVQIGKEMGKSVELIRFTVRESVEVIHPTKEE